MPVFWQHHIFLPTDHSAIQLALPAVQSKGNGGGASAGGVEPGTGGAQPLPVFWQHQIFLPTDDSAVQLA